MKKHLNNKGYLLPMVLIFIVITLILGMGILYLGGMEQIGAKKRLNREKAFYIAEAGAYRAHAYLTQYDVNWIPEDNPVAFGGGEYECIEILPEPDRTDAETIEIIYEGTVNKDKKNEARERVKLILGYVGIFADGIFGKDSVSLQGNVAIDGYDSRDGSPSSDYIVGSNGSVDVGVSSSISGEIKENQSRVFPEDKIPFNISPTTQGAPGLSGSYQIDDETHDFSVNGKAGITTGDYRFNDFAMSSSNSKLTITGTVRLLIDGTFSINANNAAVILSENSKLEIYLSSPDGTMSVTGGSINEGGSPADVYIYSASEKGISFGGNVDIYAVLYAPAVEVIASKGTPEFRGCIVSDKITTIGTVDIYYDVALKDADVGPKYLTIIRWTKPNWTRFQ